GGGRAGYERFDLPVGAVADEPPAGDDDPEVDRGEDGNCGDDCPGQAADEVADKGGGDHDGPGGDEAHGDGVEELAGGQPVVLDDHALAQERHDGQAAAEDERAGLGEEQPQRGVGSPACGQSDPGVPGCGQRVGRGKCE